ncbi:MAG: peptidylprolyl isomerase [Candidatus Hydrogenedens sp.]|nr:peptidylprolyl isomerase [Candidatus Hydrogenedens sp.]
MFNVWNRVALGLVLAGAVVCPVWAQDDAPADAAAEPDKTDELAVQAYALGVSIGNSVKCAPDGFPVDDMVRGLKAALAGDEPEISAADVQKALQKFNLAARSWMMECREKEGADNEAKAKAFLETNAKEDGWKVTDSGLQYMVIEAGDGASPTAKDQVTVHYRGTLTDGTQFDSSYDRGQPTTFFLNQVIPGWTEGLQLMKPGAKFKFAIPPDLGYGVNSPGSIPPNSVLIFEVELLEVTPATAEN